MSAQKKKDAQSLFQSAQVYLQKGYVGKAVENLSEAAQMEPDNAPILAEYGRILHHLGRNGPAQQMLARALILDPDNKTYKILFLHGVAMLEFESFQPVIRDALMICLSDPDLRHRPMYWAWRSQLLRDPDFKILETLQSEEHYKDFLKIFEAEKITPLLNNPFLLAGLKRCLVQDLDFERLITFLRRYFLCGASAGERQSTLPFLGALGMQCFYNEYIFYVSDEEKERLKTLDLNSPADCLVLAGYQALYKTDSPEEISQKLCESGLQEIAKLQIDNPLAERALRKRIKSFGAISDDVSLAVQEQYEENPYPRWLNFGGGEVSEEKRAAGKDLDILVAGCGTGQQSAIVATNFPLAHITGIDLSRASLAYATRKSQEIGFKNIEYLHGDILEVGEMGRTFDYIACGGVLHHMKSPTDGLRALRDVLKPGGVMRIGLYSEIARQGIAAVQRWVIRKGYPATSEGIRDFRQNFLKDAPGELIESVQPLFGFYSESECRDSFFHVQEHRFTFLSLREILEELDLEFLDFADSMPLIRQRYQQLFPDDPLLKNFENWHRFEQRNPRMFLSMYKILIARKGERQTGELPDWLSLSGAAS